MAVLHYLDPATQTWKPIGDKGLGGPTGPLGAAGAQGPRGATGPTGPAGASGADGAVGPTGLIGPTGPKGLTGDVGPQGNVGSVGTAGAQGPQGNVGAAGPAGPQGRPGQPVGIKVRWGYKVVTPTANAPKATAITFSSGTGNGSFTTAPRVFVAANSSVPGTVKAVGSDAITATGCNLIVYRTNTTDTGLHWIAIGT
jgi:Collagen triple helix repeat (20 copies)